MGKRDKLRNLTKEEKEEMISEYDLKIAKNIKIDDNDVDVTCRICGKQCKRLTGHHLRSHNGLSSKEYRELFDDAPIYSLNHGNTISENMTAENNPIHKSNTTDEFRKSISPFSIEFYNKRYPEKTLKERQEMLSEFAKKAAENTIGTTSIEYYTNQGMSQEEAEQALIERQTTFSKEICIEKYGKEEGMKVWKNRQEKWLDSLPKLNYSKISQELFIEVWDRVKHLYNDIYFATLDKTNESIYTEDDRNFEFRLETTESYIKPDFYIESTQKIIEFDGVYYHKNTPENAEREEKRDAQIAEMGIDLLHICESEFMNDREKTIQKCIDFLLERGEFDKNNAKMNDTFN